MQRIFLLSPASSSGQRARMLFNQKATFALARSLQEGGGASLGEVFSFLSGLYFRGKLAYALNFATPPEGVEGIWIITPSRGLMLPGETADLELLREFASVPIDLGNARYRVPAERDAHALAERIGESCEVVLLGSVATDKYVSILQHAFGERLHFPADFVGRGDMSRGGLMLRCVDTGEQLSYVPIAGAVRNGSRPPKLEPRPAAGLR